MPLRYTDHRTHPALEQELRELWRVVDGLRTAAPATNVTAGPGGVAQIPPASADGSGDMFWAVQQAMAGRVTCPEPTDCLLRNYVFGA